MNIWSRVTAIALRTYEEALSLYPDNARLLVDIGNTYAYMGDYQKAEEQFKAMIQVGKPDAVRKAGLNYLARFYPYLGKYSQMKNTFEELIELAWSERDTNTVVFRTLSKILRMGWGHNNSEKIRTEVMKVEPLMHERLRSFDLLNFALSQAYFELGDLAKGRYFRQKLRGNAFQAFLEAKMYQTQQKWALAISLFERHSRINGGWKAYNGYQVAECYYEMGELDRAIAEVTSIQKSYRSYRPYYYPMSFLLLGKIYEKKWDTQLAIENYEKFLDLWKDADEDLPDLIEAKVRLAKLQETTRR